MRNEIAHAEPVVGLYVEIRGLERVEQRLEAVRLPAECINRRQRIGPIDHRGHQAIPQRNRRVQRADRAEPRRGTAQPLGLGGRVGVAGDERVDRRRFVGLARIERVRADEIFELVAGHVHARSAPCASSACAMRLKPRRIRDFAVPSGIPSSSATCR